MAVVAIKKSEVIDEDGRHDHDHWRWREQPYNNGH